MGSLFSYDNKFFTALSRITDAIILGVLWMICCIPVFTIGTSSTAFYYAYNKSIRQKRGYVWSSFFEGFKTNFKQSTKVWLLFIAMYVLILIDCIILQAMLDQNELAGYFVVIIFGILLLIIMWSLFLFPYMARFEDRIKVIIKNSILITIANAPWALLLFIVFAVCAVVFVIIPITTLFVPAIYMWIANLILERVFRKYMTPEDLAATKELEDDYTK